MPRLEMLKRSSKKKLDRLIANAKKIIYFAKQTNSIKFPRLKKILTVIAKIKYYVVENI